MYTKTATNTIAVPRPKQVCVFLSQGQNKFVSSLAKVKTSLCLLWPRSKQVCVFPGQGQNKFVSSLARVKTSLCLPWPGSKQVCVFPSQGQNKLCLPWPGSKQVCVFPSQSQNKLWVTKLKRIYRWIHSNPNVSHKAILLHEGEHTKWWRYGRT